MTIVFLLGFFLDPFEIMFIIIPIAGPVLITLGADPLWLGVLIALAREWTRLGHAVLVVAASQSHLRSVAPPEVTTGQIYRGIVPFVVVQLLVLAAVWLMPAIATELPRRVFGY